jgi:hypothetical protein
LEGSAFFQMPPATTQRLGGVKSLGVQTQYATFHALSANFSISTRGDTVELNVFEPDSPLVVNGRRVPLPFVNMSGATNLLQIVRVEAGKSARSIADGVPQILRRPASKSEVRP